MRCGVVLRVVLGAVLVGGRTVDAWSAAGTPWNAHPRTLERSGSDPDEPLPIELRVPRMDTAGSQLAHARRLKARSFRAKEGSDRSFWRTLTIEAYRAVRVFHPQEHAEGAEAAFRAGELLRSDGEPAPAAAEFAAAVRLGAGTAFRARAGLELGHLARRDERWGAALQHYAAVAADPRSAARYRERAWIWTGRVRWDSGETEAARLAWRGVVDRAGDPFLVLRAHDELTASWIADGDLEAAAGQLERCRMDLRAVLLEESERGERLVEAYRNLSSRRSLRRAIAERMRE